MLIGAILGDAHIGRTGSNRAFLTFEQSNKKADYLNHLYKLVSEENLTQDLPKLYTREDTRYNKTNESLYFRTKSLEELKPLSDMFLDSEGKKVIPTNIADHLTPRSLAFWIMDDGQQVKNGGVTLCTDSYSEGEVDLLRKALEKAFNISTTIHDKKGKNDALYQRIYIGKSSLEELKPSLKEHMHDSMLYKINEEVESKETGIESIGDNSDIEIGDF